jgi:hypothetical protein
VGRCLEIIELWRYQEAHDLVENADSNSSLPKSPMIEHVVMAQVAIQKAEREAQIGS